MMEQGNDKASSFEAVRARLLALAYRMLGSRAEAEDVVQDVWLKWHLADTRAVQTPAAWLTTLTTRTAIDRLRQAQRERASQASGWLPEPWLDEVAPSAEELALRAAEMSYGVMLLLERLKPDERAAFVLHEAFDCDYAEIAGILERTPAACRQIVHRAKARLQRAGAPSLRPDPAAHAQIVERLRTALEARDRTDLLRLFSDSPEIVSDAPVCACAPVCANEPAAAGWVDTVTSLAHQANTCRGGVGAGRYVRCPVLRRRRGRHARRSDRRRDRVDEDNLVAHRDRRGALAGAQSRGGSCGGLAHARTNPAEPCSVNYGAQRLPS